MEEGTRIVQLSPEGGATVTTFEEAFGEHSNAHGKGRKRRQKRRMERIMNKRERKLAKQETKTEKQEARHDRKKNKKSSRLERRHLKDQYKETEDEATATPSVTDTEQSGSDQATPVNGGADAPQEQYASQDTGSQDNSGGGAGDTYAQESAGDTWGGGGGGSSQEQQADNSSDESSDDSGSEEEGSDDAGDEGSSFAGDATIHPRITDLANKIEWNKEVLSRLNAQRAKMIGQNYNTTHIDLKIATTQSRIKELMKMLEVFSHIGGNEKKAEHANQIKRAFRSAHKARIATRTKNIRNGGSETPVNKELNPEISTQKIVVPPSSNATGTGLNGLDMQDDFDAPPAVKVELTSNASGSAKKININWKAVGIGAAIAVGLILLNNKYKVVKFS